MGQTAKLLIGILQDMGATQTVILESVFPFSTKSGNVDNILLQGIGFGTVQVFALPLSDFYCWSTC